MIYYDFNKKKAFQDRLENVRNFNNVKEVVQDSGARSLSQFR